MGGVQGPALGSLVGSRGKAPESSWVLVFQKPQENFFERIFSSEMLLGLSTFSRGSGNDSVLLSLNRAIAKRAKRAKIFGRLTQKSYVVIKNKMKK